MSALLQRATTTPSMHMKVAGICSAFELAIRFVDWAEAMPPEKLTWQAVREKFGTSRATSYRWLAAYKAARGLA